MQRIQRQRHCRQSPDGNVGPHAAPHYTYLKKWPRVQSSSVPCPPHPHACSVRRAHARCFPRAAFFLPLPAVAKKKAGWLSGAKEPEPAAEDGSGGVVNEPHRGALSALRSTLRPTRWDAPAVRSGRPRAALLCCFFALFLGFLLTPLHHPLPPVSSGGLMCVICNHPGYSRRNPVQAPIGWTHVGRPRGCAPRLGGAPRATQPPNPRRPAVLGPYFCPCDLPRATCLISPHSSEQQQHIPSLSASLRPPLRRLPCPRPLRTPSWPRGT